MNIHPAQYHRNSKKWQYHLGKAGVVLLTTRLEVTTKELESFLPYCFLLVQLESGEKIEVMGEAQTNFLVGDTVRLELRKLAQPDQFGIIPYGLKACKLN